MAKPNQSRNEQTVQEQWIISELLAELQAIEERRQYAVSLHTLMDQHGPLEIPVQYGATVPPLARRQRGEQI
jgi:hypothetical protein